MRRAPNTNVDDDDDEKQDAALRELDRLRKELNARHEWRRCPRRHCRRARTCASADFEPCALKFERRAMSPQQEAAATAALHKALRRRIAEIEAAGEEAEANSFHFSPQAGRGKTKRSLARR